MNETLLSLFASQVARGPERTALRYRSGGIWRGRTWSDWRDSARAIAACLVEWGVEPGDRVAILSHTRLAWVETDIGVLSAGAAMVPVYPTLRADAVGEILRDSGAKVVFAEDPVQVAKLLEEAAGPLPALERVVVFEAVARLDRPDESGRLDVTLDDALAGRVPGASMDEAMELGRAALQREPQLLRARREGTTPESVAAIYYTSGTSGEPKGVILTHDNFVSESAMGARAMPVDASDEQLLFLPLAHIVAKLTIMLQLRVGFVTSFAESLEQAADDCAEVRPTFIVGVPRVYEKIQEAIQRSPGSHADIQRRVFDWALEIGHKASARVRNRKPIGAILSVQRASAERLVFSRIQARLGGRIRFMLSGAAPLATETAEFFHALGLLILEGYGLTETTGASTLNLPHRFRFGSVGVPLSGLEVELADDGEILIRGRSVSPGYWGRDEETRASRTDDGFFRTGDIGSIDADGFLTITDRKKDLIITAGGKNLAPQRIEQRLTRSPLIDRAIVLGDRRKFAVALLSLDTVAAMAWADKNGLGGHTGAILKHPKVRHAVAQEVERVNHTLASFESVKRFEIIDGDLDDLLTPTGKIKRAAAARRYADVIDQLYEGVTTELEDLS